MMTAEISRITELINEGYITCRRHPDTDLYILNYTPKTQFENKWEPATECCRGLIVDVECRGKSVSEVL